MEKKVPDATWTFSDLLLLLLIVTFGTAVVSGVVDFTLSYLLPNVESLPNLKFLVMVFGQSILSIFATQRLVKTTREVRSAWAMLGLKYSPVDYRQLLWGVLVGLFLAGFAYGAEWALESIHPNGFAPQAIATTIAKIDTLGLLVLIFAFGAILAPVSEEILYRGFTYPLFQKRFPGNTSLWLCGALFGLMHLDLYRFLPLTVTGVILNWLYKYTGNLYPCIIAHVIWNGIMTFIVYSM